MKNVYFKAPTLGYENNNNNSKTKINSVVVKNFKKYTTLCFITDYSINIYFPRLLVSVSCLDCSKDPLYYRNAKYFMDTTPLLMALSTFYHRTFLDFNL